MPLTGDAVPVDQDRSIMRISVIIPTMDRPQLLDRLLSTLIGQTLLPDEVIIIDQSADDATSRTCDRYRASLPITYLKAEARGVSAAKNVGYPLSTGDIITFADDDCWYPPDLLEQIHRRFTQHPKVSVITGTSHDEHDRPSQGRWSNNAQDIDRFNIWTTQTQYTTFYRKQVIDTTGQFNEELGTGTKTGRGAGEETEYMLRALDRGFNCKYDPELVVYHPEPLASFDAAAFKRCKSYNLAFGRVMRLARYPLWFVLYLSLRPVIGGTISMLTLRLKKCGYQFLSSYYRLRGWIGN